MEQLNLSSATTLIRAAIEHASANNWLISVAVVDAGGNLVMACRMDGAGFLTPEIARGKAFASAAWRESSENFVKRLPDNPAWGAGMIAASDNRMTPVRGGLPIFAEGRCVGAAGASGVRSHQDEECVRAGILAAGFTDAL